MSKATILKYFTEFTAWCNDQEVYVMFNNGGHRLVDSIKDFNEDVKYIILKDSYFPYRKALAEGKTIEKNYGSMGFGCPNKWDDFSTKFGVKFKYDVECYRIKPDEPKLKVGDWVIQNGSEPFQLTENTCFLGLELWKPQPGEYIWDNTYGLSVVVNVSLEEGVLCRECFNGKVLFTPTMKEVEPFTGTLPSSLQDQVEFL